MKKLISMFIAGMLFFALIVGQCNDDSYEYENVLDDNIVEQNHSEIRDTPLAPDNYKETSKQTNIQSSVRVNSVEIPMIRRVVPEQIIKRTAYTISYNKETKCPNWVAWRLTARHVDGEMARSDDFREDSDVPFPRASLEDYRGSGWSRGHMCPAGDNKWDAQAMSETFLLTNVCPQDRKLNSGLWNRVEMDCRKWAKKYGEVYIACGPLYYNSQHKVIGGNSVVVPEAFYKVILCLNGNPKAIGFVVKNNDCSKKKDQYVNSIDDVERITGIDFFPSLPDDIEDKVESCANLDEWK